MTGELDDLSGVPRYVQVARIIEAEIRTGEHVPGMPAPSRTVLAQRFGIAKETAAKAHRWLRDRGYVAPTPGVGMTVTAPDRWDQTGQS